MNNNWRVVTNIMRRSEPSLTNGFGYYTAAKKIAFLTMKLSISNL